MGLVEARFMLLDEEAKLPTKGTDRSAGYDFYSLENVLIKPKQRKVIRTGLAWEPIVSMKDRDKRQKELEDHGKKNPLIENHMSMLQELNEEIYSFYHNNFLIRMEMSSRSSLFSKHGLLVSGKIDEDYRGEIGIMVINNSTQLYEVKKHERIAQGEIALIPLVDIKKVKKLSDTSRGTGGFGSTGKE